MVAARAPGRRSRLWQAGPVPSVRASVSPGRPSTGPRPCGAWATRRFDVLVIGGRDHRGRGRPRRRLPGAAHRPGRAPRLRLGHVVEVLQDGPRRAALPPAARLPARLRGPARTPAPARQRPAPGRAPALPHPPVRPRRGGQQERGPRPTPPPSGSTTSPAAGASASATGASTRAETLAHLPTLRTDRLVAGFIYYDARADDARLTLAVARTAALDHGAVVANYTEVTSLVTRRRRAR